MKITRESIINVKGEEKSFPTLDMWLEPRNVIQCLWQAEMIENMFIEPKCFSVSYSPKCIL